MSHSDCEWIAKRNTGDILCVYWYPGVSGMCKQSSVENKKNVFIIQSKELRMNFIRYKMKTVNDSRKFFGIII